MIATCFCGRYQFQGVTRIVEDDRGRTHTPHRCESAAVWSPTPEPPEDE